MYGKTLEDLTLPAKELATISLNWLESYYDEPSGLLWYPGDEPNPYTNYTTRYHLVRESTFYALGLLLRDQASDRERAASIIAAVLENQFDQPDKPYHGTFKRSPEELSPPEPPQQWVHYDPNWREFIGVTFAVMLTEYETKLPKNLLISLDKAFLKIAEGMAVRPLSPTYSNIALMHAFLWQFLGNRFSREEWVIRGETMAEAIYTLFQAHQTFHEYNSPTYYGVDLYALAMWRGYAHSEKLRRWGSEIEALLWSDIARFYHAGLKNLSGPFDRSYGMNLLVYSGLVGLEMWAGVGREFAPYPDVKKPFQHTHDFCVAPLVSLVGTEIPVEAKKHLTSFQGERLVERIITAEPKRVATAWLSEKLMLGGEHSSGMVRGHAQYHPLTIYWEVSQDVIGWLRLRHIQPVDVTVAPNQAKIEGSGKLTFQISVPETNLLQLKADQWELPGLTVAVETQSASFSVEQSEETINISYELESYQALWLKVSLNQPS